VWTSLPGTREEPGTTLTQGGALFSLVPLVWESNPKLQSGWCKSNHQPIGGSDPNHQGICRAGDTAGKVCVCVYYCSTYYKAVRVGGAGTMEDMCYERLRAEACVVSLPIVCVYYCSTFDKAVRVGGVFITAVPIIKLFAWGWDP
jgi:hypothetical protein